MNANKITAYLSGIIVALTGTFTESHKYSFIWMALVFFPLMLIYVIGLEIWREWAKGENIKTFPIVGPKNKEGWRIYGRVWLRMVIFILGAVSYGVILYFSQNI